MPDRFVHITRHMSTNRNKQIDKVPAICYNTFYCARHRRVRVLEMEVSFP